MWLGSSHPDLVVLFLRSNHFFGSFPSHLCHLKHLQLLDLALNHISGSIPKCINSLTALTSPISTTGHLYKGPLDFFHCDDLAFWLWKGRDLSSNLGQIKSIDLSSNKITGPIPREIMELVGLISLNLSRNLLTRRITTEIGALRSLEVLDLSENQLSGGIPSSIALINSLNFLDLSNNNLSGIIPTGPQLNTFNATAYEDNPNLCGFPLPKKCPGETNQNPAVNRGGDHAGIQETEDGFITPGFYVSVALGFVIGFLGVFGTLLLNRSWQFSHFNFLNNVKDKQDATVVVNMARLRRQHQT
ncbi:receptor-like protein EIX2 [Quercus lobata]|nr:receptor-like protein EIX2 [Quercus lobata]